MLVDDVIVNSLQRVRGRPAMIAPICRASNDDDDNDNDFVMLRNMLLVQQFEVSFIEWI